jgi:hypothetical protein
VGGHALAVHDVVLLLDTQLRVARAAGTHNRAYRGAGCRTDPGAATGVAAPAAAADSGAEASPEGRGQQRAADRLVVGGGNRRSDLSGSVLLTAGLVGGKRFKRLVRARRHRNRWQRWLLHARR